MQRAWRGEWVINFFGFNKRALGASKLKVSRLCLGTMMFGDRTDEVEATRIADHALDAGVNFIDTADVYAEGRSEEIVGRITKAKRNRWVIASKIGNAYRGQAARDGSGGLSPRWIAEGANLSLARLGVDHIDLYYIHRPDPSVAWEDVVAAFGELIAAGKIRYWGLSNVRAWHIAEIVHLCRQMNVAPPVALQPYYNLMNRQPEVELLPAARHFGLGAVPYSPLARGVLSGKYAPGAEPPEGSRAARGDQRMLNSEWRPESLEIAQTLKAHAETRGSTLIDFALAWVLNNRAVTSVIAGPRTFDQWIRYVDALKYKWTADDEKLADSLVRTGHPSTPGYNDPAYPIEGRFPAVS